MPATLRCTVRGCGLPLVASDRALACAHGHSFDRARRGYVNLLQPQDRRSRRPGDSPEVVAARARLLARGVAEPLVAAISARLAGTGLDATAKLELVDVGCGDGFFVAALAQTHDIECHGVDLSVPAIEAAARRLPAATWVVANVDHGLPWMDGAFDVVLAINARLPGAELHRVLRPEGRLLVAVPANDDLAELRERALGAAPPLDKSARLEAALGPGFERERTDVVRHRVPLDRAAVEDALIATWRAGRSSRSARLAELAGPHANDDAIDDAIKVTFAWQLVGFRRLPADPELR